MMRLRPPEQTFSVLKFAKAYGYHRNDSITAFLSRFVVAPSCDKVDDNETNLLFGSVVRFHSGHHHGS